MAERNWAGNLTYRARTLHHPGSLDELREIVARAERIRPLGTRHSFNDIADTEHELVALDRIDPDIRIDEAARTVTASGGARYGDLATVLEASGWAVPNLASLPHISIAGAVATGTHGSGDRTGSLATSVSALELVTADGETARLHRGQPDFDGAVVSLGALGVVARVTLDIVPSFLVRQAVYADLPWSSLVERFDEVLSSAYSVSVFLSWNGATVERVWLKSTADELPDEVAGARPMTTKEHPVPGSPSEWATEQLGVPGPWHERLPHFRMGFTPSRGDELQSEYLVARADAPAAIEALRAHGDRIAPLVHISEIRTMAADELWLSPAYGRDTVGFHFTWKQLPEQVSALLPALEDALEPFDARPHWGKLFAMGSDRVRELYPRIEDVDALLARYDPDGTFGNDYMRRVL